MWRSTLAALAGLAGLTPSLHLTAQADGPLVITRLTGPIKLDGRVDEPAWQAIAPLPLTMFYPTNGAPVSQPSEVRLAYDNDYFYASARFLVSDPSTIRSGTYARDQLGSEDHFLLLLDTYNDNENGMVFVLNPAGAQTDYSVGRDGQNVDASWNSYWDGATSRDAQGWYAEMRIPLSTLRFQSVDGQTIMGLIVHRKIAQNSEMSTYPALSTNFANALFRPSVARKIRLDGLQSRSPLYVTPYALGGFNSAAALNTGGTSFIHNTDASREAGLDAKFGVTSNLTLDATVNTDFAQVEADNQQVNLTQFSLFFPEKRQFFLERGDVFTVNTGGMDPSRLFHSRRIGLDDNGNSLRIYGGGRLVGRAGGWDLGALDLQTASPGGGSENVGVLRLRRQAITQGSYLGLLVTSRVPTRGGHNLLYAGDANLRPFGNDYFTAQWAQSFDAALPGRGLNSGMARLDWERRSSKGLYYNLGAKWAGSGYNPGLGFEQRSDYSELYGDLAYGWYPGEHTVFQYIQPNLMGYAYRRNPDHSIESAWVSPFVNFALKSGLGGTISLSRSTENLLQPLDLSSSATVPAGEYHFDQASISVSPGSGARLNTSFDASYGKLYDGTQLVAGINPSWDVSAHLRLSGDYHRNRIRFASRGQRLDADIFRLRVEVALNSHLSAASFVQYNRAGEAVVGNLRVRWHFAEGRDLWVVYNDLLNTDRTAGMPALPELPLSQDRTLLLKYTYTFAR